MAGWPEPTPDPKPESPPDPDSPFEQPPFERPPFDQDPEAQRAPGAEDDGATPPPMQASAASDSNAEIVHDGAGIAREPVGNDNIREGRVGGVMGPPHAAGGLGAATAGPVSQLGGKSLARIALAPGDHGRARHPESLGDLGIGDPFGGQQQDLGPLDQCGRRLGGAGPLP